MLDLKRIYKGSQNVLLYTWRGIVLSVSDKVPRYRALKLSVIYRVAGGSCGLTKTSDIAQCGSLKSRTATYSDWPTEESMFLLCEAKWPRGDCKFNERTYFLKLLCCLTKLMQR